MNPAFLFVGIASVSVGALCVAFPKFLGANFNRLSRSIWERHQDDLPGRIKREIGNAFPAITPDFNDDARSARTFRILGVVFLIQALLLFVLSVVIHRPVCNHSEFPSNYLRAHSAIIIVHGN